MITKDNFVNNAEIIQLRLSSTEEGNLSLKVKTDSEDLTLECFVYGNTLYNLNINRQYGIGDLVRIRFALLAYDRFSRRLNRQIKSIVLDPECANNPSRGNIDYIVEGEIIRVNELNNSVMAQKYVEVVLDCGIYLHTDIPKSVPVKVGDYMQMRGRLDVHIVGKVN